MSKFDEQLERMNFLMEYRTPGNNKVNTNIEYSTVGADGKSYGIIREGAKYYIKTTSKEKANIKESYEYIGGFMNRNENAYKSYNDATKHLELKLMALNESYGKKEDVSTVDFNRSQKCMSMLTEEARKELDRVHMIMENADTIGKNNTGDPEGKHSVSNPAAQGDPYTEGTKASLDKDPKTNGTVKGATPDNTEVSMEKADKQLQNADKKEGSGDKSTKDYENAKTENLEGKSVATLKEGLFDDDDLVSTDMENADLDEPYDDEEANTYTEEPTGEELENIQDAPEDEDDINFDDEFNTLEDAGYDLNNIDNEEMPENNEEDTDLVGLTEKCDESCKEEIDENAENTEPEESGEKAMKGPNGSLPVQSWDKMTNEQIDRLAESVCNKLFKKKKVVKESLQDKINRIIKEEATKLGIWGKHPRYGKQPMTTPPNNEVLRGTADRDFNDNSAKGSERYGKKIGSSAPFDIVVDNVTDAVVNMVKESILKKK